MTGVEAETEYDGPVRPTFATPNGIEFKSTLKKDDGEAAEFLSGTVIFETGNYELVINGHDLKENRTRSTILYFKVKPLVLALMEPKSEAGVPNAASVVIGEMLKANMLKTKLFKLVDNENIAAVLKEQSFQQSGCTDSSCVVQLGRLLAANKMLTGTITKNETGLLVSVQIMNVEKGELDFAESIQITDVNNLDGPMEDITAHVAARILGVDAALFAKEPPRRPYVLRSLALPGWGQYNEGRTMSGKFFGIGTLTLGLYTFVAAQNFRSAQKEYDSQVFVPASPNV